MRYLLDTATWSNGVMVPEVLPQRIRKLLGPEQKKAVCSISLLEIAIHFRKGRLLPQPRTLTEFFERGLRDDVDLIDITSAIAAATNDLPEGFPGDPFDRVIAATARELDLTLITPDPTIRDAAFCRVEFYPFRPSRA